MKKIVFGIILGLILGMGLTAYADDIQSMIGKKIDGEFEVRLNGKSVGKAPVIEGVSYLPLRTLSESIGYEVSFDASKGIDLKEKEGVKLIETIVVYPVKSNTLKLRSDGQYYEVDGLHYTDVATLGKYLNYDSETKIMTFDIDGTKYTMLKNDEYTKGTGSFTYGGGTVYVCLESLNLQSNVIDGTLWIER